MTMLLMLEDIEVETPGLKSIAEFRDVRVKAHRRNGKMVKAFRRTDKRHKKQKGKGGVKSHHRRNALLVGAAAAGLVGVSGAAYIGMVSRYRAGFRQSAKMAENMSKGIKLGKVKNAQKHLVFGAGGTWYSEATGMISGENVVMTMKRAASRANHGADFKGIPVNNSSYNLLARKPAPKNFTQIQYAKDSINTYIQVLRKGRNPAAVEMAANVIAYGDKFPDRQLIMAGHSSGGFIVHEAQEILRIARPEYASRLKSVSIGTEWYGATNSFGKSVTLASKRDPFTSRFPTRDPRFFGGVKSHSLSDYGKDDEVQRFLKRFIYDD